MNLSMGWRLWSVSKEGQRDCEGPGGLWGGNWGCSACRREDVPGFYTLSVVFFFPTSMILMILWVVVLQLR